jgi:protein-S-isoprenylcysteine O-methyltransferase Ste14
MLLMFSTKCRRFEHQEETSQRERTLNLMLVVLALLTVFSVVVDVGTFLDSRPGLYGVLVVTTTGLVLAVLGFIISLVMNWRRLVRWWHRKRSWRRIREGGPG